jgi:hypothetical protein
MLRLADPLRSVREREWKNEKVKNKDASETERNLRRVGTNRDAAKRVVGAANKRHEVMKPNAVTSSSVALVAQL